MLTLEKYRAIKAAGFLKKPSFRFRLIYMGIGLGAANYGWHYFTDKNWDLAWHGVVFRF